jgi:hypothetical protein
MLEVAQQVLVAQVPEAREWLTQALAGDFAISFASAARRVGRAPLALSAAEQQRLGTTRWSADELARACLLLSAAARADLPALVEGCFHQGDNRERSAVLKTLPLLPAPERFIPLAAEACRTNVVTVFEAIACENPFPAAHFSDAQFNQMTLKAVFLTVAVSRIVGLDRRRTPELARMARDYASERHAAGRPVPTDLELLRERP